MKGETMAEVKPNGTICVEIGTQNWEKNLSNLIKLLLDLDYEIYVRQTDDKIIILNFTYDPSKIGSNGNRYMLVTKGEEKGLKECNPER